MGGTQEHPQIFSISTGISVTATSTLLSNSVASSHEALKNWGSALRMNPKPKASESKPVSPKQSPVTMELHCHSLTAQVSMGSKDVSLLT